MNGHLQFSTTISVFLHFQNVQIITYLVDNSRLPQKNNSCLDDLFCPIMDAVMYEITNSFSGKTFLFRYFSLLTWDQEPRKSFRELSRRSCKRNIWSAKDGALYFLISVSFHHYLVGIFQSRPVNWPKRYRQADKDRKSKAREKHQHQKQLKR